MNLFAFIYLVLPRLCLGQLKQCYSVNGTPMADFPCDPGANVSACCGHNYTLRNELLLHRPKRL